MTERGTLRFDHPRLRQLELPCFAARGAADGPRVCLLAGIHGGEYSSIAALVRFMCQLDERELRGSITAVPVVSLTSFRARSAFVVPEDGKNLNRCFPGEPAGSFSDALAYHVFSELIEPSDALLDLHGGDVFEALEPFALYEESDVEDASRALAVAFDLPYVVRTPRSGGPVSGTTSGAAAAAGVPAAIAEVGGRGQLEEAAVQAHLHGIANALRTLGALSGEPQPRRADMRSVGRFVWLRCANEGWWEPAVRAGQEVARGDLLGTVSTLLGEPLERVEAPEDGVVLFLTSSPAVPADGLLLGLGGDVAPIT